MARKRKFCAIFITESHYIDDSFFHFLLPALFSRCSVLLGLWGIVNNAGILDCIGPADWMSADDYRRHCNVNLFGLIDVTMTFLLLVKKSHGRIVNMSSNFGRVSYPAFSPYSVSKFGIEAFTDSLRCVFKTLLCWCIICCVWLHFLL